MARGSLTGRGVKSEERGLEEAPAAQSRRPLLQSLGVRVEAFRCRAGVDKGGVEEANPSHSVVFVRRGVFAVTDREGTFVADANQILFFNEGQPYRFAHPLAGGDDCLVLALEDDCARAALARVAPRDAEGRQAPFSARQTLSTRRTTELQRELLDLLVDPRRTDGDGGLSGDDLVAELVDESVAAAYAAPARRGGTDSTRTRSRRRELVEAAKLVLNERLEAPPRLSELAAGLGFSPFHLSRTFREVTGLNLRGYLRRLRARLAADHLERGPRDLTALALDLGFCDHSHFTNAFRGEWGVSPSRFRRARAAGSSR